MQHVIVSRHDWHSDLLENVARRTGYAFARIDRPEQLSLAALEALDAGTLFFPHWSHRIPADIHTRYECVIFHMTDLPFGRGGSPLQNLIARGISETRITALRCVEGLDAGPIYLKHPLSLHGAAHEIYRRAGQIIEDLIVRILLERPEPAPQRGEVVVFDRRRSEDGNLAGLDAIEQVHDYIRMLDAEGYPKAFIDVGRFRLEFSRSSYENGRILADVIIRERNDE